MEDNLEGGTSVTKVVFETATIADAVKKAERVSPSKGQAFDMAAGFVLEIAAAPMPTVVRATNLEIFCMEWITPLEVEGDAVSWRVPSALFTQVITSLPIGSGKVVTLEEKVTGFSSQLHMSSGRTKAKFNLLDISHYPKWTAFDPDTLFEVKDLGGRIAMVEWATDNATPPLAGVHLNGTHAIGTDRYRLAATEMPISELENPITIPAKILSSIIKQTGEVKIGFDGNQLLVMPDEYTQLRSVIYAEAFPNMARALDMQFDSVIKMKKEAFLEILQRASNFAGGDRMPELKVFVGKEEVAVMMNNDEIGLLGDVYECPGQAQHARMEMMFTPKNIIEAIANAPSSELEFYYNEGKPTSMIHIDGGSGYKCWVAPRHKTEAG